MIATLALLLSIHTPGLVTKAEFGQAEVGMTKHHIQHDLWDAKGTYVVKWWDEVGDIHVLRDYPTPHAGDLRVEWRERHDGTHMRLYRATWPAS